MGFSWSDLDPTKGIKKALHGAEELIKDPGGAIDRGAHSVLDSIQRAGDSIGEETGELLGVSGFGLDSARDEILGDWFGLLDRSKDYPYVAPEWTKAPRAASLATEPDMQRLYSLPSFAQAQAMRGYDPDSGGTRQVHEATGGYAALPETYAAIQTEFADNPAQTYARENDIDMPTMVNRGVDFDRSKVFDVINSPQYRGQEGYAERLHTPQETGNVMQLLAAPLVDWNQNYTVDEFNALVDTFWGNLFSEENPPSAEQLEEVGGFWPPYIDEDDIG